MPRQSLPSHLKNLKTYGVLLTQTTEEDLLKHLQEASKRYESHWQGYYDKLNGIVQDLHDRNPYRKHNWRKGSPERRYKNGWEWNDFAVDDDDKMKAYYWIFDIRHDLKRCGDEFKWGEKDDEIGQWYRDFEYQVGRLISNLHETEKELKWVDERNFASAKKEWETEDAEWIDYQKRLKEHQMHRSRQAWLELFARDKESQEWYIKRNGGDGIPNTDETCEFCIRKKKQDEEYEARRKVEEAERLAEEERYRQEREEAERRKAEERQRKWAEMNAVLYTCEDCDFSTRNKWNYENHLDSKQHAHVVKQKSLFCKQCQVQCRTQMEYDHHVSTNKHKKAIGEVKEKVWRCEACDYTASLKHHYENHCKSKKHQEKVRLATGVDEVQIPTYQAE